MNDTSSFHLQIHHSSLPTWPVARWKSIPHTLSSSWVAHPHTLRFSGTDLMESPTGSPAGFRQPVICSHLHPSFQKIPPSLVLYLTFYLIHHCFCFWNNLFAILAPSFLCPSSSLIHDTSLITFSSVAQFSNICTKVWCFQSCYWGNLSLIQ